MTKAMTRKQPTQLNQRGSSRPGPARTLSSILNAVGREIHRAHCDSYVNCATPQGVVVVISQRLPSPIHKGPAQPSPARPPPTVPPVTKLVPVPRCRGSAHAQKHKAKSPKRLSYTTRSGY